MTKVIPVTILTGFLWSGKTTLLNNILKNKQWYKIAVIENEYGEESIDSELIGQDVAELIEIKDGCMCCIVRWDLIRWVEQLLNSWKEIDYIIIEASGMSEPMPVAQTFIMEDFWGRTKLDSIVCIVDAQNFHNKMVQSLHTTMEQLESAHFILLNKTEWVSAEKINEIKYSVREVNPHSSIIESNFCNVDINYILDTELYQEESIDQKEEYHNHDHHEHSHDHHDHNHDHHSHAHDKAQIEKYFFKTDIKCSNIENMREFLSQISDSVFRMKGFLHFNDYPNQRFILQKAGSCFTLSKDENWSGDNTESKIVFIGKDIHQQELHDRLFRDVFVG